MKILVLAEQWFPDYAGGTARVVRATAEGLVERGHEISLVVPQFDGEPEVSVANGVEVRRVLRRGLLPQTATDVYETHRAVKALGSDRFDLALTHHVTCATAARGLSLACPTSFVFHASPFREARHRRSAGLMQSERWRSLGVESLLYLQERIALKHADQVLVLSDFSRQLVLKTDVRVASAIEMVGGGVDTEIFAPADNRHTLRASLGITSGQKVLVSARRLVGRMGLEMLLTAFHDLYARDDSLRLVVIGEGELRTALESQRDRLGLERAVQFIGRVSDEELRDWYCAADVFVLPTVAYEGFGMVTAEALACGTPVVGTPVGATRELLAPLDPELITDEVSAGSLGAAISCALAKADPMIRAMCRRYAQERLSWDRVLNRWEAALVKLVSTS